ncbi:MAG TPA: hypothetical protein VN696_14545 [Pyrinomonadaceae bacterium]|nr:hypothetical protein [Pyrinomonadaceae bacterium]
MGFLPTFCRAFISLHKRVGLKGPLLTLGNQDIWANYDDLKSFFKELDCPHAEAPIIPHTSRFLSDYPGAENYVHARTFFEMFGIKEYYDIDKFEIDAPQILHDLNAPVPEELRDRFNLIVDSGTIEHIFDVRQVMENMISMCRLSGWIVHITPASNFMDHGFYSFSPCFFYDFYRANGFDDFVCHILQINPDDVRERSPYFQYHYGMDLRPLIDPKREVLVFFAARKIRAEPLVIPTQGAYRTEVAGVSEPVDTSAGYQQPGHVSIIDRFIPRFLVPYLGPIRPLLGAMRGRIGRRNARQVERQYEQLSKI